MKNEHLDLPAVAKSFKRKTRAGRSSPTATHDAESLWKQILKLNSIGQNYRSEIESMGDYDQKLVFKIQTVPKVSDEHFRNNLKRADVETWISNSGEATEWIATTHDPDFSKLKSKIKKRIATINKTNFIDEIKKFDEITFEDKLGPVLKKNPLQSLEIAKLSISLIIYETDFKDKKLDSAIKHIKKLVIDYGYRIYDKLKTKNLCLLLIDCDMSLLRTIAKLDLVNQIDRIPDFTLERTLAEGQLIEISVNPPPKAAPGVLVMDSGVIRHPLLDPAIPSNGYAGLTDKPDKDDRSHGTQVSGNLLYGNLEPKIRDHSFVAKFWLYSAKIFYESGHRAIYDPDRHPLSVIAESLADIKQRFPNCRVVNLSFGNPKGFITNTDRQPVLASLIDDLSNQYPDTMFIVSLGNAEHLGNEFLARLCDGGNDLRLTDPASSVHALSIGALQEGPNNILIPSNITRIGPGFNDMIKPELVELGGGIYKKMIVLNPDYRQKTFTKNYGTSFSTPIISNYLAELVKKFPNYSRNLIIALLFASSKYPPLCDPFPRLHSNIDPGDFFKICSVYGYGKPNLEAALTSDENRVVLKYEGSIEVDHVKYFEIKIPDDFATKEGRRTISVSLVFDPPVRRNRADYFGIRMGFHMFRNRTIEELQKVYNNIDLALDDSADQISSNLHSDKLNFKPNYCTRMKTPHQKGVVTLTSRYSINPSRPLILVVICQKKWNITTQQNFSTVVTLEHENKIDLYNKLQALNAIKPKVTRLQITR